jgi:hypothetical protein
VGEEGSLQAIENWRTAGEAFHRRDFATFNLTGGDQAGTDWVTIQEDSAGAAIAGVAADFRACQAEIVAQDAGKPAGAGD